MSCVNHPGVTTGLVRCAVCLRPLCRDCATRAEQFFCCGPCLGPARPASVAAVRATPPLSPLTRAAATSARDAGLLARAAAAAIDALIVVSVLAFLLSRVEDTATVLALTFGVPTLYEAVFLTRTGQTVGKAMVGIRVVSAEGGPVGDGQAWGRSALKVAQFGCCGLPLLAVPLTAGRSSLHDRLAGTRVVPAVDRLARAADR